MLSGRVCVGQDELLASRIYVYIVLLGTVQPTSIVLVQRVMHVETLYYADSRIFLLLGAPMGVRIYATQATGAHELTRRVSRELQHQH